MDVAAGVLRSFSSDDAYKDLLSSETGIGHWPRLWPFLGVLHFRHMGFRLVLVLMLELVLIPELIDTSYDEFCAGPSSNDAFIWLRWALAEAVAVFRVEDGGVSPTNVGDLSTNELRN